MTLHLGLSSSSRTTQQQQQIKDAKRLLRENVRNDWDYPPLPEYQLPARRREAARPEDQDTVAGFRFHTPDNYRSNEGTDGHIPALHFDPLEWREREYSSEESATEDSPVTATSNGSKKSIFRFEGPDSVGVQIEDRKHARKRQRQQAMDEEVTWNSGLAHWLARRDAWCGARTQDQIITAQNETHPETATSTSASDSTGTTPRTSTSSASSIPGTISSPATTPELIPDLHTVINTRPPAPPSEILVPVAPTILPNHPIRKRITPEIYPEIYSKIILQSRTPSVPINLPVLVKALVQGWKDDGEWPPKQGSIEKSIGHKKGSHESTLKSGVKAVGRVLRITGGESSVGSREKG